MFATRKTIFWAVAAALASGAASAEIGTNWNSADVPELSGETIELDGSTLKNDYWGLATSDGAAGTLLDASIDISALKPKDGTSPDKQLLGIFGNHSKGSVEFGGSTLHSSVVTNFIGGGNNQVSAFGVQGNGDVLISADVVDLSVVSQAKDGKSIYGLQKGGTGVMTVTSGAVNIELTTATDRGENATQYSETIGVDVWGGKLETSETTQMNIKVHSTGSTLTAGRDGASDAYGVKLEGGQANLAGDLSVEVDSVGGNAAGVSVTNYFYNSTMGENWNDSAANFGNVTATVSSVSGKASAIEAVYTKGEENTVIMEVTGDARLEASTETGEAYGVNLDGDTTVELKGNVSASASATGEGGKAYSLHVKEGELSMQGAANSLRGDVAVTANGSLAFGTETTASNTTLDGSLEAESGTTVKLTNATLELSEGSSFAAAGTVTSSEGRILLNEVKDDPSVSIATLSAGSTLGIGATGALNDQFASSAEARAALEKAVSVASSEEGAALSFSGEEGGVSNSWTAVRNEDGTWSVKEVANQKLEAYGAVSALAALQWRHETNDLSKRMGELRDNPGSIGGWVRLYGSEMEYGGQSVTNKSASIQVGSDYQIGDWKVGGAFSYTDGSASYDLGEADSKTYALAVYGTWMAENGMFVDLIGKYGRLSNDFELNGMDGDSDNNAYSVSAEFGWRFEPASFAFIEPQAEVTYSRIDGDTFTTKNAVRVEQDDFDSLIGRVGVRIGAKFPENLGNLYLRVSGAYDFQGENEAVARAVNGVARQKISDDLGGGWIETAIGGNFRLTDSTNVYVDLERTNGGEVVENWRWNLGLRTEF